MIASSNANKHSRWLVVAKGHAVHTRLRCGLGRGSSIHARSFRTLARIRRRCVRQLMGTGVDVGVRALGRSTSRRRRGQTRPAQPSAFGRWVSYWHRDGRSVDVHFNGFRLCALGARPRKWRCHGRNHVDRVPDLSVQGGTGDPWLSTSSLGAIIRHWGCATDRCVGVRVGAHGRRLALDTGSVRSWSWLAAFWHRCNRHPWARRTNRFARGLEFRPVDDGPEWRTRTLARDCRQRPGTTHRACEDHQLRSSDGFCHTRFLVLAPQNESLGIAGLREAARPATRRPVSLVR